MSHTSPIFSRVPIDLPNRSGFDMSHENLGTMTTGTLIPVLVDELLPNDTISLGANFQVQLPPMATDFFGRVDVVLEAFFVPNRLLWGGWKNFMTHPTANPVYPDGTLVQGKSKYMPRLRFQIGGTLPVNDGSLFSSGTLADYLGVKSYQVPPGIQAVTSIDLNALPFVAYHRIWDDWYRDSRIQSPLFYPAPFGTSSSNVSYLPFQAGGEVEPQVFTAVPSGVFTSQNAQFSDGISLNSLRQRNFSKDYFTTASPLPQTGNAATLEFDVEDNTGTFSIAALRSANSLQKWMERNNIMGYRYADQIYGQYGVYPSDAIMDKCLYLGRISKNVYNRSVFQTATGLQSGSQNPFSGVASKYGSSMAVGEGSLVDNIRVKEHGFLIVLASLVPHAYYSTGCRRYLQRSVVGDIAFPLLSGMGEQAIYSSELYSSSLPTTSAYEDLASNMKPIDEVFGYTDLYAEYKYHDDEVHGFLRDGSSLESFALQRGFSDSPELSSEFLQIPVNYLDQVKVYGDATPGSIEDDPSVAFDAWYDIYFPYKKISTLPEYSLPTLGDLKNVHKGHASRGGTRL